MNTLQFVKNKKLAQPWLYFLATFIWTWSFFGITYALRLSAESGSATGVVLILIALSGPGVMGMYLLIWR